VNDEIVLWHRSTFNQQPSGDLRRRRSVNPKQETAQRTRGRTGASRAVQDRAGRDSSRIDLQLVLASRWIDGTRLPSTASKSGRERAIQRFEVYRRP
jgi:hypothetical protein